MYKDVETKPNHRSSNKKAALCEITLFTTNPHTSTNINPIPA
jgi:hypothetical protein